MPFVSESFLAFAFAFYAVYFVARPLRVFIILAASLLFAGIWDLQVLAILCFSIIANCAACHLIASSTRLRRFALALGISINIAVLAYFKYADFFVASLTQSTGKSTQALDSLQIIIPIGLSFYTFQAISLLVDVSRKTLKAPSLLEVALLFSFWPKLIAGPIIRGTQFIPQLRNAPRVTAGDIYLGLELIIYGLLLKTVVGDYFAPEVNRVYDAPAAHASSDVAAAVLLYTFQIYGDFAGYSLMAVGFARLMGLHIISNFLRPNFASSFSDFWRRWHISLSRFLNDYVYRSLPWSSQARDWSVRRNMFLTMLVSGAWHGSSLTFLAWGALHGVYLNIQRSVGRSTFASALSLRLPRSTHFAQICAVFACVAISRVFFRAEEMGDALEIFRRLASGPYNFADMQNKSVIAACAAIVIVLVCVEWLAEKGVWRRLRRWRMVRTACASLALLAAVTFGEFDGGEFAYARF